MLQSDTPAESVVFELPMRDGNEQGKISTEEFNKVFELPMRDGNRFLLPHCQLFLECTFLNFLWGMETKRHIGAGTWTEYVFELPMRDGNRKVEKEAKHEVVFLNFLWGMETR